MATRELSLKEGVVPVEGQGDYVLRSWDALADDDDVSAAINLHDFSDATVGFTGDPDSGTFVWEGSFDETTWFTLNDLFGEALSFSAAGCAGVAEIMPFMRARAASGISTASTFVPWFYGRRADKGV
jgi:hypothetical protein